MDPEVYHFHVKNTDSVWHLVGVMFQYGALPTNYPDPDRYEAQRKKFPTFRGRG